MIAVLPFDMRSLATPGDLLIATVCADIAIVLLAATFFGRVAVRLRQPKVIGEVVAGILLGPSLLGNVSTELFPLAARPYLATIAQLGLLLFMFGIGWEFDFTLLRGKGIRTAGGVSLCSVAVAFGLGVGAATLLYSGHSTVHGHHVTFTIFALFLGTAMSITAFPVLARILQDKELDNTRVGVLALACAAVDDVVAWSLLALVVALATSRDPARLLQILVVGAIYILVMIVIVRPMLARLVCSRVARRRSYELIVVLTAGIFLSSYATTWMGVHAIFGAFAFGLAMPRKPFAELSEELQRPLDQMGALLLPVFFAVTGLSVDIGGLSATGVAELGLVLLAACGGKVGGSILPARASGLPWRDTINLGLLMNTRGLTELVVLNMGLSLGVLDRQMFTILVLMAVITTAMTTPLLRPNGVGAPGVADESQPFEDSEPFTAAGAFGESQHAHSVPLLVTHERGDST